MTCQVLGREILEWNLILSLGKVEAFHIGTIDCFVAFISQRNVNCVFMEMSQNVGVKFLASVFICGDQNLSNSIIDLCFIIQTELCCIIAVYRVRMAAREDCGS